MTKPDGKAKAKRKGLTKTEATTPRRRTVDLSGADAHRDTDLPDDQVGRRRGERRDATRKKAATRAAFFIVPTAQLRFAIAP